jgi:hypothetical protein
MCSKSNPIVVIALYLMSTYEGEHTIFGLLGRERDLYRRNLDRKKAYMLALIRECYLSRLFAFFLFLKS